MDFLKSFVLDGTKHDINILWEDDTPYFRAFEIANVLGMANVRETIRRFDDTDKVVRHIDTNGGKQETLFLTECGLYKLLMISRKPNAKPFQKWVYDVIISIRRSGKYELNTLMEKGIADAIQHEANRHKHEIELIKHKVLVNAFKKRNVVYFGKIRDEENDKSFIKIGSTDDISVRITSLQKEFGSVILFHVIEVPFNRMFEEYLQSHPRIVCYVYKDTIYEGRRSNGEVFLMTPQEIENTLTIAKRNSYKFATDVIANRVIEVQRLKCQTAEARAKEQEHKLELAKLAIETKNEDDNDEDDNDEEEDTNKVIYHERRYTQSRGSKIQRYDPNTKALLFTYTGMAEATRDSSLKESPLSKGIKDAIKRCSIYKGYRWLALDRSLPDNTVQELQDTVSIQVVRNGYVAMLNLDKTEVVKVFCDQIAAKEDRHFNSCASISLAIRRGSISGGHYFQMWADVSPELQEAYLKIHKTLPDKRVAVNARAIEQVNPLTNKVEKRFSSAADIAKNIRISRNSLKYGLQQGCIVKGWIWRYADS